MKEVAMLHPQAVVDSPLKLPLKPVLDLTDDHRLYDFCQLNRNLQIERTAEGDLLLLGPAGGETSRRNARLVYALEQWAATISGEPALPGFSLDLPEIWTLDF